MRGLAITAALSVSFACLIIFLIMANVYGVEVINGDFGIIGKILLVFSPIASGICFITACDLAAPVITRYLRRRYRRKNREIIHIKLVDREPAQGRSKA